jgi:hypothetical protein
LLEEIGHVGRGQVRRHRELLVQGSADLGPRLAGVEQAPDGGCAGVQRMEAAALHVEKNGLPVDDVQAEGGEPAKRARRALHSTDVRFRRPDVRTAGAMRSI